MNFPKVLSDAIRKNPYGWSEEQMQAVEVIARLGYIGGRRDEAMEGHAGLPATLRFADETAAMILPWMRGMAAS